MKEEFIPYARQSINEQDIQSATQALSSSVITRGEAVAKFEQALAGYCGAKYAVAVNSGSSALQAACYAAKISPFDRIISTPNTFIASVGTAVQCGATPTFVDIDTSTGNLDLKHVEYTLEKPYSRGRPIIIPVHFAGIPVDIAAIDQMLKDPNAIIIEDGCHALGSEYLDGRKVGSCAHSQMTVFSFHPAKAITTGEGGMVTTNDENLYHRLLQFRNNGIERDAQYLDEKPLPWYYEVHALTGNYNFTEFQAALGLSQLERLDEFIAKRRKLVNHYRKLLKGMPHITLFSDHQDSHTGFHLFVIQINFQAYQTTREAVMEALKAANIGSQVHYIPIYRHPVFKKMCGDLIPYFPKMESYYSQALSLPLYADLTLEEVEKIVHTLLKILKSQKRPQKGKKAQKKG